VTWKIAQVSYYRKPERFGGKNYPKNIGRAKELAPGSEFEFFVVSNGPVQLPRWIRLGKWHSKAEVTAELLGEPTEKEEIYTASAVLNPLDVPGRLRTFDVVSMPPVSLVLNARLEGTYYTLPNGIQLPAGMQYFLERPQK
jgi:CRISPR-associated protein Csc1